MGIDKLRVEAEWDCGEQRFADKSERRTAGGSE